MVTKGIEADGGSLKITADGGTIEVLRVENLIVILFTGADD